MAAVPLRWAVVALAVAAPACERAEPRASEEVEAGVEASAAPAVEPVEMRDPAEVEAKRESTGVPVPSGAEDAPRAEQTEGALPVEVTTASEATAPSPAQVQVADARPPEPAPPEPPPGVTPSPALETDALLDLEDLEKKLRETRALGVFTKLALKNDIDDFVADVRSFHERRVGELAQLRERFELLLMKVLSLLQDKERELAEEIARSREALWNLLADPREFARLEGK